MGGGTGEQGADGLLMRATSPTRRCWPGSPATGRCSRQSAPGSQKQTQRGSPQRRLQNNDNKKRKRKKGQTKSGSDGRLSARSLSQNPDGAIANPHPMHRMASNAAAHGIATPGNGMRAANPQKQNPLQRAVRLTRLPLPPSPRRAIRFALSLSLPFSCSTLLHLHVSSDPRA